jgi:hypothetical protein
MIDGSGLKKLALGCLEVPISFGGQPFGDPGGGEPRVGPKRCIQPVRGALGIQIGEAQEVGGRRGEAIKLGGADQRWGSVISCDEGRGLRPCLEQLLARL